MPAAASGVSLLPSTKTHACDQTGLAAERWCLWQNTSRQDPPPRNNLDAQLTWSKLKNQSPNQNYNVDTAKIVRVTDIATGGIVILPYELKTDS